MCGPEDFIRDQFPAKDWPTIPTVLVTAYRAAEEMVRDNPALQVESAKNNKGRFISYAVDFGIVRAIENASLNCDFEWVYFARPTGRYLELRFSHSTASVSQVEDPRKQPRNVVFRENARLNNQKVFDFAEIRDEKRIVGLPHFLIVHGHQALTFAHLGVPSAQSKAEYSWRSQNLMRLPHEIADNRPPMENTDVNLDELDLVKEDIERWRRDNGSNR